MSDPIAAMRKITHYYPLYSGWIMEVTPLFSTPSAALCFQLSRYLRDGICYSPHSPSWTCCIAGITLPPDHAVPFRFDTSSKIEAAYFAGIQFSKLGGNVRVPTMIFKATNSLFNSCRSTLKDFPDYQGSANSIYRKGMVCISEPGGIELVSDRTSIPQTRDNSNLISIGFNSKAHFCNTPVGCTNDIGMFSSSS